MIMYVICHGHTFLKMSAIMGILKLMIRTKFMLIFVEHDFYYYPGPGIHWG